MVIHKIKMLKGGKWAVHPALGPIIDLVKDSVVDICDCHCIYNKNLSDDLISNSWAEIVKEVAEVVEIEGADKSSQKKTDVGKNVKSKKNVKKKVK